MKKLIEAAKKAQQNAYAPYSRFPVGAAILTRSGKVFTGANVENSAYPLSRCAEQIAVGAMVTAGEREIEAVVVASTASPPAAPCGACRQILAEFAGPEALVVCVNDRGEERRYRLGELLPEAFSLRSPKTT